MKGTTVAFASILAVLAVVLLSGCEKDGGKDGEAGGPGTADAGAYAGSGGNGPGAGSGGSGAPGGSGGAGESGASGASGGSGSRSTRRRPDSFSFVALTSGLPARESVRLKATGRSTYWASPITGRGRAAGTGS